MSRQNSTCPSPPVLPNGVLAPNSANMSARSRQAQQINVQTSCGGANFVRKIMTLPTTIGSFNFADNQINATVPFSKLSFFTTQTNNITFGNTAVTISLGGFNLLNTVLSAANPSSFVQLFPLNTGNLQLGNSVYLTAVGNFLFVANTLQSAGFFSQLSLFTKQQEKILFGNSSITMTIGSFNFTNNQITATVPSSELNLFTNQTSGITIGNFATPTTIGSFSLATNLILSTIPTNSLNLFTNQSGSIVVGNPNITCNIGSFNLMNKRITTTAPNDLITILDTQIGGITMGHLSGPFTLKASTANINATTSATITSPTTAINATTSATITSPSTNINATTTTITSPTTAINATTSATITSPSTNINATTKVDITTPNLNVKASNGNYLEVLTEGNDYVRLDFHSNSSFTTDFDSRIASTGGTASDAGGTLNLASGTINFNNATTVNSNTPKFNVIYGGNSLELATGNNNALIDFHSNSSFTTDYDSRIIGYGGSALDGSGAIAIQTNDLNLMAPNVYIRSNLFRYVPSTSYTPTLTVGSCVNLYGSYSIMGNMMTVIITGNTFAGGTGGDVLPPLLSLIPYGYEIPAGFTIKSVPYGTTPTGGAIVLYNPAYTTNLTLGASAIGNGCVRVRIQPYKYEIITIQAITNTTLGVLIRNNDATSSNGGFQAPGYYPFSTQQMTFSFTATFPIN
jgi:hypothetical protein